MSSPLATSNSLGISCVWTVKEKRNGLYVPVLSRKNLFTTYGLTAFASAFQPQASGFVSPQYLVIENFNSTIQNAGTLTVGSTSVTLAQAVDEAGDTQLVLGVGTANQEAVTWSSKAGAVYTISATTKTHVQGDPVVRMVRVTDGIGQLQSEQQYDATNAPNQRLTSTGGYSPASSQWIMQFFITGTQAQTFFGNVGLADSLTVGLGNLHNHVGLGYNHPAGTDVEVDVTLTLTNN